MEGIYLAAFLEDLRARLPAGVKAWSFPAPGEALLALEGSSADLAIIFRPGEARLEWRQPGPARPAPPSLGGALGRAIARQARGVLEGAQQVRLDRVAVLNFTGARGFVDEPPRLLVLEATGHRAALLLLDQAGRVLQAAGPGARRRQGAPYQPPPAQAKLNPRASEQGVITEALRRAQAAGDESVTTALIRLLDGVGPVAAARICDQAGVAPRASLASLSEGAVTRLARTAGLVASGPGPWVGPPPPAGRSAPGEELRARALVEAERRLRTERARLGDARRAIERAAAAHQLKARADELMLEAADRGREAVAEAQALYQRYQRRRQQAERAVAGLAEREAALASATRLVETLRSAPGERVEGIARGLLRAAERRTRKRLGRAFEVGGFELLVGRNAAENERLTFEVAAPRDLWLHARDHAGSHVILRTAGQPVAGEVLQKAAGVAAYYSKARGHTSAEVQVARVADVRRVKGVGAGLVRVDRARTVMARPLLPGPESAGRDQEN